MSQLIIRTDNLIITDPALKHEIEDVLSSGFRLLRFPDYLEQHFARSGPFQTRQQAHQRRFSAPGFAHHAKIVALINSKLLF